MLLFYVLFVLARRIAPTEYNETYCPKRKSEKRESHEDEDPLSEFSPNQHFHDEELRTSDGSYQGSLEGRFGNHNQTQMVIDERLEEEDLDHDGQGARTNCYHDG